VYNQVVPWTKLARMGNILRDYRYRVQISNTFGLDDAISADAKMTEYAAKMAQILKPHGLKIGSH
jgi:hypothetical protein